MSTSPSTQQGPPVGRLPSAPHAPAAQEFRSYRRFVTLLALGFIFFGSAYLLASVGVTIYRQRHAVTESPVSALVTLPELRECWKNLSDVSDALQKRLENLHGILAGAKEAQSWAEAGVTWRKDWKELGQRCRLTGGWAAGSPKEIEKMASAYNELAELEAVYTKDLLRFGKELAPRLDRLRKQIQTIDQRLEKAEARAGDQQR